MKKVFSLIGIFAISVVFADEIDEMVSKINSPRESNLSKEALVSLPSPMPKLIIENNNSKESNISQSVIKEEVFNLKGIMNNSAFINGKWVKIGEKIGSFELVDIMDDSVYLKDGNRTKLIFFKQNNGKIKITVGR